MPLGRCFSVQSTRRSCCYCSQVVRSPVFETQQYLSGPLPYLACNNTHQTQKRHKANLVSVCCHCRKEPNEPCSLSALRQLGVLAWKLDADNHETDPRLAAIKKVRGYSYTVRRCQYESDS